MTGLESILTSSIVHRVGWTLLHSLWQAAAVAALLAGAMWILRRRSASLRYAAACAALLLMLALPAVTIWLVTPPVPPPAAEEQLAATAHPEQVLPRPVGPVGLGIMKEMALSWPRERRLGFLRP